MPHDCSHIKVTTDEIINEINIYYDIAWQIIKGTLCIYLSVLYLNMLSYVAISVLYILNHHH
jgi:hypothetical protein